MTYDRETDEEATVWGMATVREREISEGGRESGRTDIYRQVPSFGGTVGGPPAHIRSLLAG